ncbi:GGDEF domain-containing protein [Fulvimonas sp. R45]|uniref:GGDEF domain-containing protein n=1 Tax=Fulvimonas sp. R45 TaxID=3045937 RepID=UPI00265E7AE1|nr:GGDEF domain-containing protein [Fulvimonas sp. R45]MDO1529377.1 GGDEF domain-containing protein [Fulvimonas sp. R45]
MRIDLATIALFGALQALLLAPLLLAATRAYTGVARTSLRIWGTVLLLQAVGWVLMGLRGHASDWLSIVLANGVLMVSYAESARALRLLLGAPQRRLLLAAIGVAGWLGIAWFGVVEPDYRVRVYIASVALGAYLLLLAWPLRHALRRGGSSAQRVMLLVLLGALLGWCGRLGELLSHPSAAAGLLAYSPANAAQMIYSAVEPVLASVGFLLMYNEAAQAELHRLARTDPLTGTLNRLALDEEADRLFQQAGSRGTPLAVLMIDVDHFKRINDDFGHAAGDRVLAVLAASIAATVRPPVVLGRMGGEEFLALLPDTGLAETMALAERMRAAVAKLRPVPGDGMPGITVSAGIAVRGPDDADVHGLIRRADRALYDAKRAGRNRVVTASG